MMEVAKAVESTPEAVVAKTAKPYDVGKKTTTKKKLTKEDIQKLRETDSQMVRGVFHFYEVQGGSMSFSYKAYNGDQVERYDMVDGGVYTIPLGVARHLRKNLWYPEYDYVKDENTKNVIRATRKVRRGNFEYIDFIDPLDQIQSNVIEAAFV